MILTYDYINKCNKIPNSNIKEKYLILYAYSGRITDEEADWISSYAKSKKLKVYAIGGIQKCADKFIDCSPFEVLAYFKNAEEIITDTFHGSIFSIINHKPFTTIVRKSKGNNYGNEEKLSDLLRRLQLENHMTYNIQDTIKINSNEIKYDEVDQIIQDYRKQAKEYLKKYVLGDENE